MAKSPKETAAINVAEAKRSLSELLGRVAFAGETVIITRRGRPMAKLVPVEDAGDGRLTDVRGWLDEDDPFFSAVDACVGARSEHAPRVLSGRPVRRASKRR